MERMNSARKIGVFLGPEDAVDPWVRVVVEGPDAASFLQSQTTNDVVALEPGQGNMGARTTRTGHLVALFSCHRGGEATPNRYELVVPMSQQATLFDALDSMHFSDDCTISCTSEPLAVLQGPDAVEWVSTHLGESLAEMKEGDRKVVDGGLCIRRSLTGDPGFLLLANDADTYVALSKRVQDAGGIVGAEANEALHGLQLDAGWPNIGVDTIKTTPARNGAGAGCCELHQGVLLRPRGHCTCTHLWHAT